jgi:hypothetical protein
MARRRLKVNDLKFFIVFYRTTELVIDCITHSSWKYRLRHQCPNCVAWMDVGTSNRVPTNKHWLTILNSDPWSLLLCVNGKSFSFFHKLTENCITTCKNAMEAIAMQIWNSSALQRILYSVIIYVNDVWRMQPSVYRKKQHIMGIMQQKYIFLI